MAVIRHGIAASALNLGVFCTICLLAVAYHWYKQIALTVAAAVAVASKRKKKDSADNNNGNSLRPRNKKLVVISGCDRGFGRLLAQALILADEGLTTSQKFNNKNNYLVMALTLTEESAAELLLSQEQTNQTTNPEAKVDSKKQLFAMKCDVTSDKDAAAMKEKVEEILEREKAVLFAIVNNAGIVDPGDFCWFRDLEIHRKIMEVNYFGQLRITQALLPIMLRTSALLVDAPPRILNVSSVCGTTATPGNSAYSASKFAVEAWSDSLRLELQPFNVHVVKVRPGSVRTDIQSDFFDGLMRNYAAAPDRIRAMYGGDQYENRVREVMLERLGSGSSRPSDPKLVVDSLKDIIELDDSTKVAPYYWIGADAHTLWKALHLLPTSVVDTFKSDVFQISPIQQELPPVDVISHLTIRVRSIAASVAFYEAFGFTKFGPVENGQQFLRSGTSKSYWATLLLLDEDANMKPRGKCSDVGMTRLSIMTTDLKRDMQMLASKGIQTIAPVAQQGIIRAAVYQDPDNFVVYLDEFLGLLNVYIRALCWWGQKRDPCIFHWTVNCISVQQVMVVFDILGFKKFSDLTKEQVLYNLLSAFDLDPSTSVIEHIRLCKLPEDSVFATLMEWTTPKSECNGAEMMNTMTVTVSDVHAALDRARSAGMIVPEDGAVVHRRLPVFGEVLIGTAYLEKDCNRIEFCCFSDRRE